MSTQPDGYLEGPAALVAIAYSALRTGDRTTEREARRELRNRYGIDLTIRREPREVASDE